METGDRLVQRKLDFSRAVVAQRVEKLAAHWLQITIIIAIAIIIVISPFTYLSAQVVTTTSTITPEVTRAIQAGCDARTVETQLVGGSARSGSGPQIQCYGPGHTLLNSISGSTGNQSIIAGTAGQCNWAALDFGSCIWNPLITLIASLLMSLAGMVLTVAGSLFDLLITKTVIDFRGTLEQIGMLDSQTASGMTVGPITRMWAMFRDVANILIIGIFVFVAISTILSIENYGVRKWIAKILIVAVLINFSMFFTKITIDISNFVAREFYKTMPSIADASQQTATTVSAATDLTAPVGIAGTFMNDIGISGVWDWKYEQLSSITSDKGKGPLVMLSYSLGAAFFMLVVALTLLYGSFLLASRAILLVFLLITSSLAFASMLLPGKFAEGAWGKWKTSLINSAVFAPLLMLLLAATLLVLEGVGGARGDSSLNTFLLDPANMDGWSVLFTFIVASGMLFVSIKVANSFAAKIAGFNYAAAAPAFLGSIGLGAIAGASRFGIGSFARLDKERLERKAARERGPDGTGTVSDATQRAINNRDWLSKQTFDARNLKPVQGLMKQTALAKIAGATPFLSKDAAKSLTEGSKNTYAKDREAVEKKQADWAKQKRDIDTKSETANATQMAKTQNEAELENARRNRVAAETAHATAPTDEVVRQRREETDVIKARQAEQVAIHETRQQGHQDEITRIAAEIQTKQKEMKSASNPNEYSKASGELRALVQQQAKEQVGANEAKERITQARKISEMAEDRAQKALNANQNSLSVLEKAIKTETAATKTLAEKPTINAKEVGEIAAKTSQAALEKGIGRDIFSMPSIIRQNAYGISNEDLAKKITKDLKKKSQDERIKAAITSDEEKKEEKVEEKKGDEGNKKPEEKH